MADFTRQRQFRTREAVLPVDKGLAVGTHTFELVVTDDGGNQSKAAQVRVEVFRLTIIGGTFVPIGGVITDPIRTTIIR